MTRLEAIIYAIGKLDGTPQSGLTNEVELHDCHECFANGYLISRVNIGKPDIYLEKRNREGELESIIYVNRNVVDTHTAAVLIEQAYSMYLKRHKNE